MQSQIKNPVWRQIVWNFGGIHFYGDRQRWYGRLGIGIFDDGCVIEYKRGMRVVWYFKSGR